MFLKGKYDAKEFLSQIISPELKYEGSSNVVHEEPVKISENTVIALPAPDETWNTSSNNNPVIVVHGADSDASDAKKVSIDHSAYLKQDELYSLE